MKPFCIPEHMDSACGGVPPILLPLSDKTGTQRTDRHLSGL